MTVGDADPLLSQSQDLIARLEELGVEVDSLRPPPDHIPPLAHEYQFDVELDGARGALDAIGAFVRRIGDGRPTGREWSRRRRPTRDGVTLVATR